ncbi:MAG: hypothetical protein EPO07_19795 [Verrucomicrobia bacterium]|nr:MAG: hypothetical protein EPO07_19795 [Verrucomicrobiota bacterium]
MVQVYPTCGIETDQNPPAPFFPVFAAYTGTNVASLTPANNLPLQLDAYPNAISFDAVKGQTYQIAFDGNEGTTGDIELYLALTKPARNDSFERRIKLRSISANATSYNAGATHQLGEPLLAGSTDGKTVWWTWRAPVSGTVALALTSSDHAFPLGVYRGKSLEGLQVVAQTGGGMEFSNFEAEEGQTYQIAVSDFSGLTGKISLALRAPIIECPLLRASRLVTGRTLLRYTASPGQVVMLLSSADGVNWKNGPIVNTHRNNVDFLVTKRPTDAGPFYRAIVVDRFSYSTH